MYRKRPRQATGGKAPRPRRPPALNVQDWTDVISLEEVPRNAAYYLHVDVMDGRVQRVYAENSLRRWLQQSGGQGRSPVTRRQFSASNIRKVPANAVVYMREDGQDIIVIQ